jgi:hypothetical protein
VKDDLTEGKIKQNQNISRRKYSKRQFPTSKKFPKI